jgi:ubiquinone/menaquinone biosynthesis C-methylase UbiE
MLDNYKQANIDKYLNSEERKKFLIHPSKIVKVEAFKRRCRDLVGKDEKILDIGGGAGVWTDIVREQGITGNIYALDISDSVLSERNPKDICTVGDMESLPYEDNTFDRAMFFAALHHVKDTDKALSEARRVVKPGGYIVLYEPISLRMLFKNKGIEPTPDGVEFCFSIKYLLDHLKKNNLKITYMRYEGNFKRFFSNIHFLRLAARFEELYNMIPLIRSIMGFTGNEAIIVAKK